ncbi:ABC transporter ATP-binding protein [Streptomyces sp. MBT27]|uniref:ABC transporter ATP-binding protein n=1 Tax=Streptomyces sp. MBT27 TaxID=1488356 RepID=UPI0014240645|nr:ABC transporter ATP-binding protein [Streptomyces sp. MBT27]
MHILVGLVIAVLGATTAVLGPKFAKDVGTRRARLFDDSNTVAFRLIGSVVAILGVLYAAGVVGRG